MNVDTGAFQALTAQVAELAEQVRKLQVRDIYTNAFYAAGYEAGKAETREAMLGRAAKTSRPARPRPPHLQAVQGGSR